MSGFCLGRRERARMPFVPHYSALIAGTQPMAAPSSLDYTKGLPANLGSMLNNTEGDCAEAAYGHFIQIDSYLSTGTMLTLSDASIQALAVTQGLDPSNPGAFGGTVLQSLLSLLVKTGITMPDGSTQKLFAFVEVDPRNDADLNLITYQCGAIYLGFDVPAYLKADFSPGSTWDVNPSGDQTLVGGHCIISPGYAPVTGGFLRRGISWGSPAYELTPPFWTTRVTECYGLLSPEAITRNGGTFAGLTVAQWDAQMNAVRMAA
jgi:hypothetical protein